MSSRIEGRAPPAPSPGPPREALKPPAPAARPFAQVLRAGSGTSTDAAACRTPMAPADALVHLREAWQARFGAPPDAKALGVLWSHWALETGRGRAMIGNNFGNVKGTGPTGRALLTWTGEGWGETARRVQDRFRVYDTPADGARDYLDLLARRYPEGLAAARDGDARRFGRELHRGGYFTAEPNQYSRSLASLASELAVVGPGDGPPGSRAVRAPAPIDPGPFAEALLWTLGRAISQNQG